MYLHCRYVDLLFPSRSHHPKCQWEGGTGSLSQMPMGIGYSTQFTAGTSSIPARSYHPPDRGTGTTSSFQMLEGEGRGYWTQFTAGKTSSILSFNWKTLTSSIPGLGATKFQYLFNQLLLAFQATWLKNCSPLKSYW